jgi:hypothetical protein
VLAPPKTIVPNARLEKDVALLCLFVALLGLFVCKPRPIGFVSGSVADEQVGSHKNTAGGSSSSNQPHKQANTQQTSKQATAKELSKHTSEQANKHATKQSRKQASTQTTNQANKQSTMP